MYAWVSMRAPDGHIHELVHGDLVGRLWCAGLHLNDGRISEAHAMVSLRGVSLQLVALRGALSVGGESLGHVDLLPGLEILLSGEVKLEVIEVHLPSQVLGLEGDGLAQQMLPGVCSLLADPSPRVVRGYHQGALLCIWSTGDGWMCRRPGMPPEPMRAGDRLVLGDLVFTVVSMSLGVGGPAPTRRDGAVDAPLRLVARYDTVHLHREGSVAITFSGKQARLISELVATGVPLSWQALSAELWPDEPDASRRRSRLDVTMSRIRRKLRSRSARSDLVRTDGAGHFELLIHPHDSVEDLT